ncbi:hypothetical protein JOS77_27020 [Chromobacterium haemolyticum]|nr:hypothetical protein JOS77_27020 [Chromobacterium haemolyticum]
MPNSALIEAALLAALAAVVGGFWYGHGQYQQGLAAGRADLSAYRAQVAEQRRASHRWRRRAAALPGTNPPAG